MSEERTPSPSASGAASPNARSGSPSPSAVPSLASDIGSLSDRSFSTPSTCSASSAQSLDPAQARSSDSDGGSGGGSRAAVRRRGYMRPHGTAFADSARNRDSVMSLGSIAHMQYYFARTGLLDGKGAQFARGERKKSASSDKENLDPASHHGTSVSHEDLTTSSLSLLDAQSSCGTSDHGQDPESWNAGSDGWIDPTEPTMLPPTVSTYKQKSEYIEPVPDLPVLRRELKTALQDACKVLEESQKEDATPTNAGNGDGFYEIQGLHLLDITTLAIRAAKNYYTAHTNPAKLYAIKPDKDIRTELYHVLDILKRMAGRNFRGGIRMTELTGIVSWIESVDRLLKREEAQEQEEAAERESWIWRDGDWQGREKEREWMFLKSFDVDHPPLPRWPEDAPAHEPSGRTAPDEGGGGEKAAAMSEPPPLPTEFLLAMQDGQRLVKLHNALVARSSRKFGQIKAWHSDVAKPYRMAENLRYWAKAAELRWDIHLSFPALDVVNAKDEAAWLAFDQSILKWARSIREELTAEWVSESQSLERKKAPPELKIEVPDVATEATHM